MAAAAAMSDAQALAAFLDKWRQRWPEWSVAEVFVPATQRQAAVAWFALLQELTDAAWGGTDPRPGEAKLGWWAEELHGWSQRRRRHPLGIVLQPVEALWTGVALSLPALRAAREPAVGREQAMTTLRPVADAVAEVGRALFADDANGASVESLLARHLLVRGDAAAPLSVRARLGDGSGEHALARAWATELLGAWAPDAAMPRAERVFAALLRARLQRISGGGAPAEPTGRMSALWRAWRAARG
jgi:hypothetical protein